ncbi:MAG: hypothetical protein QY323_03440 [Patescibacteria group bacterium]|nr:MAG: hypothetical protein QY323_03440 [Patescibacteria group bacterium]
MPFDPQPILDFLSAHVKNDWRRIEAREAVLPVLTSFANRDYTFRPLVDGDLEEIRVALETLFGFAVTAVRPLSLEALLARLPDEADEAYAERVASELGSLDGSLIDLDLLLRDLETWSAWRVSDGLSQALLEAFDAALPEPSDDDPVRKEVLTDPMLAYLQLQGMAIMAAAVDDDVMLKRFQPILRWFSRCMPVGAVLAEPGVIAILVK